MTLLSIDEPEWQQASQVADKGLQHFGFEVTLLGLGVDIALANNQPQKAIQLLQVLPGPLRTLPQWDSRIQVTSCMTSVDTNAADSCLQQVSSQLTEMVKIFMAN